MQAAVLKDVGESVKLETVEDPKPGPGEVVVQLSAAALNHRDVWIRKGQYAGLKFPIILGSDGVGELVGGNGETVLICPSLGWGGSDRAQDQAGFRILGLPDDGTFAERVKVPAENVHPKPDHLTDEEAATIPLAGLTAFRALVTRGGLTLGERVLVTGAGGGAASFAVQFAAAMGAEVHVTSSSEQKIEAAKKLGAKGGVNYREPDWDKQLKSIAGGFDLIVDSAGGDGFSKLIDLANPGGRIVFFGATVGNPNELNMRKVFWKQLSLLGTTMGSAQDFKAMLALVTQHRLKPIVDSVFGLEHADEALDRMERGDQTGKIVLGIK